MAPLRNKPGATPTESAIAPANRGPSTRATCWLVAIRPLAEPSWSSRTNAGIRDCRPFWKTDAKVPIRNAIRKTTIFTFGSGQGDAPKDEEGRGPGEVGRDHDGPQGQSVEEDSTKESKEDTREDLENIGQGEVDVGVGELNHEEGNGEVGDVVADLGEGLSPEECPETDVPGRNRPDAAPGRRIVVMLKG